MDSTSAHISSVDMMEGGSGSAVSRYYFTFSGRERERFEVDCESVDEARNEAVRYLGQYLAKHPGFADEGHWRVNVENSAGQELLHVIVATVAARTAR